MNAGIAMAVRIPMIVTTTSSSISVKPLSSGDVRRRRMAYIFFVHLYGFYPIAVRLADAFEADLLH